MVAACAALEPAASFCAPPHHASVFIWVALAHFSLHCPFSTPGSAGIALIHFCRLCLLLLRGILGILLSFLQSRAHSC
jgi:hypothetical protein